MAAHGNNIVNVPAAPNAGGVPGGGPPPNTSMVTLTPTFKLVFLSVLGITFACLAVALYLSLHDDGTHKSMQALNDKVLTVFNLGCGAIIGLLGGKTLN